MSYRLTPFDTGPYHVKVNCDGKVSVDYGLKLKFSI